MSMDHKGVFLSILIPCYRGSKVVHVAIESALLQFGDDIEILVSDDGNESRFEFLSIPNDPRIKYFAHATRLGMQGNYSFLIAQAKGVWLTILGQDDALLPFATDVLRTYAKSFPSAEVVTTKRAYMFWPGTTSSIFRFLVPIVAKGPMIIESQQFLKKVLKGFQEYSEGPQLYTGSFVKLSLIEKITSSNNGRFYTYPIPDVSSAANLLKHTQSYLLSRLPLFLVGTSNLSTGIKIEKSLLHTNGDDVNQIFSQTFLGGNKLAIEPGLGVFTDKCFYFHEAWSELSETLERSEYLPWALASLLITSRGGSLEAKSKKQKIVGLARSNGCSIGVIYYKSLIIKIVRKSIYISRALFGINLVARRQMFFQSRCTELPFEPLKTLNTINILYKNRFEH